MQDKKGLIIAAPSSGSGKTVITLALLRALKDKGIDISSAKAGPDYIDPTFHQLALKSQSINLDPWAMSEDRLKHFAAHQSGSHLMIEAMMGLYDGAMDGTGSAAQLAKTLNAPIILVVDAAKQSHSIAALVRGFIAHDTDVNIAGVILNKVGSPKHEALLRDALEKIDVKVLGSVPRDERLEWPERHLGLVQANEVYHIGSFISDAAKIIDENCDLDALLNCFSKLNCSDEANGQEIKPLGKHIAIACDEAFSFIYPHLIADWEAQGAKISYFSPLDNEAPHEDADSIYLPGGYPELHAKKLSKALFFKRGIWQAKLEGKLIYGECGGYMVLGEKIIDAKGKRHDMLGVLKLVTSFPDRKLHLGYREIESDNFPLGSSLKAHEFHYTSAIKEEGEPLFKAVDALGNDLGGHGLRVGNVMGSYMHVIDRAGGR